MHEALDKFGFSEILSKENVCPNITVALERANEIIDKKTIDTEEGN